MIAAYLPLYRPRGFDCLGRFSDDVLIQACGCQFARSLPSAEACRKIIADAIYNAGSGMVLGVNFVAACAIKWLQSVGISAPTARVALPSVMAPPVTCTHSLFVAAAIAQNVLDKLWLICARVLGADVYTEVANDLVDLSEFVGFPEDDA